MSVKATIVVATSPLIFLTLRALILHAPTSNLTVASQLVFTLVASLLQFSAHIWDYSSVLWEMIPRCSSQLLLYKPKATRDFLEVVNRLRRRRHAGPVSWSTAVKFLAARKFDVGRAVSLYEAHEKTRHEEGLSRFNPLQDPLRRELLTGKFTVLPTRDESGAAIAVFTARLHNPHESSHQNTLQGVVYQLDVALESVDTQRCGLVFVYDMTESKYSHFDYELSQKILTLLKVRTSFRVQHSTRHITLS
ncbi:hypothetical protein B566_EDAN013573 [Ephemera danica]|nr:hypothetical protein B566_EDAN013573 [Ephemera danica]